MEHADDSGRSLVARADHADALDQAGVGGEAADDDGQRVGHVGEQGAEGDDELDAERLGEVDDQRGEAAPAHRRLGAGEEDQVARGAGDAGLEDVDAGPDDLAGLAVLEADSGRAAWKS